MSHMDEVKRVLKIESDAISFFSEHIDESSINTAIETIYSCKGKLIVTGMGKSGLIGRKISATFSSTGTPSFFLNPAESMHGDLGVVGKGDVLLALSFGGGSSELNELINFCSREGVSLVGITGNLSSNLAQQADVVIKVIIKEEACPLRLAPTSSSTVMLALGDALAMAVLKKRGFTEENFAKFHPGGSLGRKLLLKVKDFMHSGVALPLVQESDSLKSLIAVMTSKEVKGAAGVLNKAGSLIGCVTDGDIRRWLGKASDLSNVHAKDIMSKSVKVINQDELAAKALYIMEEFAIQMLFVIETPSLQKSNTASEAPLIAKPIGIIHIQDLVRL